MSHPVKVSVIIPIYNVAEYLPFALQSCLDQTLRDVEFICVNDGSTDSSLEIARKYAALDDRIIIIDGENAGVSAARNRGIEASSGDWIMFLDPDDYLSENACERVWIEAEEGLTDIINFGTEIVPKQPKASPWHYYALSLTTKRYYSFIPQVLFGEPSAKPFIWHQAYSKRLLDETGIRFDEELRLGEDMAFLICLYPHAERFALIEDKLYSYRFIRNNSAMQVLRKNANDKIAQHLKVTEKIFEHWRLHGFIEKYSTELLLWALDFILHDLEEDELEKTERANLARDFLSQVDEYFIKPGIKFELRTRPYIKALRAIAKESL